MVQRVTPVVRTADRQEVRRLVDLSKDGGPVVSIYLDLDPERFSTAQARQSQVTSLIDDARRRAEGSDLAHDDKEMLCRDIEAIDEYCRTSLPVNGNEGLAVFCSSKDGLFDVVPLPRRVDPNVVIAQTPYIEPLAPYVAVERWTVALINRSSMRVFTGDGLELHEVRSIHDRVHRQHSQGGWSQARYERSVEQDVRNHLDRAAEDLFQQFENEPFDHLIIGTMPEHMPAVEKALHTYLTDRLRARVDVDVEHSTIDEVTAAVRPVIDEHQKKRERALLDRLAEQLGKGGRAAAGSTDVLRALDDGRVETLLLGRVQRGAERAVDLAVQQAADIVVLEHHDDLARHDGIAALLRF